METKVIKPLLRSLFISYALSALFLGALAFALYKLRRWIFHRKKSQKPAFFLGTAVRNVLFSHPFCCFLGYGSPGLYPGCQISHGIRRVCLWRNPWGNAQFLRSISSNSSPIRNTRLPKNTKISPRLKITFFSLLNSMEK